MSDRLRRRKPDWEVRRDFLQTVWYESKRAGLDVSLVLGLIQVESAFRKFAVSSVGARGYMQVMPFWTRVIGDGDAGKLFHMQTNLRFGCVILRHYLDRERGDLFMALGRYNGSRGKAPYPNAVFAAQRRWAFQDRAAAACSLAFAAGAAADQPRDHDLVDAVAVHVQHLELVAAPVTLSVRRGTRRSITIRKPARVS